MFSPTDKAFEKIPPAEMNAILKNKTRLAEIVKYHIVKVSVFLFKAGLKYSHGWIQDSPQEGPRTLRVGWRGYANI